MAVMRDSFAFPEGVKNRSPKSGDRDDNVTLVSHPLPLGSLGLRRSAWYLWPISNSEGATSAILVDDSCGACDDNEESKPESSERKPMLPMVLKSSIRNHVPEDTMLESASLFFKALQDSLVSAQKVQDMEGQLAKRRAEEEMMKKKSVADVCTILSMETKIADLTISSQTQVERIKFLEKYGRRKRREVMECVGYYTWRTKSEMMTSFVQDESET